MAKKKKSRVWMGIEERRFFEMFEPKPPPRNLWEQLYGRPGPPASGPGSQPPSLPPPAAAGRPMPPIIDARHWFDIPAVWSYIGQNIGDPRFRVIGREPVTMMIPLFEITKPTHDVREAIIAIAKYLGLPDAPFRGPDLEGAWHRVLVPVIVELERQINLEKPASFRGSVRFDFTPEGGYFMSYYQ